MLMSALNGFNKKVFLDEMSEMVSSLTGKQLVELRYPAYQHDSRIKWLQTFANIADAGGNFTVDDAGEEICLRVTIDSVCLMRWYKEFEPEVFERLRIRRKHYQPEDW